MHIFVCKEKNYSNYAENMRHCRTEFSCLGNQVPRIWASLVTVLTEHCHSLAK